MKKSLILILSLVVLLGASISTVFSANFMGKDDEETVDMDKYKKQKEDYKNKNKKKQEEKTTDKTPKDSDKPVKIDEENSQPVQEVNSSEPQQAFYDYDESQKDVREKVFDFLKNPKGLTLTAGYSSMGFSSFYSFLDDTEKIPHQIDTMLENAMGHLNGFCVGLELDHSFVDIRFSPNMGLTPNVLFVQVDTGVFIMNREEKYKDTVYINSGVYFSGTLVSFTSPMFAPSYVTNLKPMYVDMFNTGIGITHVSTTVPAILGLAIADTVIIEAGAYFNLGVLLPYYFTLDLGLLANIEIEIIPETLRLYMKTKFAKFKNMVKREGHEDNYPIFYDNAFFDLGIGYQF
ncbi:MAG: hypothetical protein A2014_12395 [Spirochaetes bacterium GWF1_49_6]|nr:MAG: hypothetical protein A2014_12395 [Spirochaetes bacterium GWF1_49_6]